MQEQLYNRLISDLKKLGIPLNFELEVKPYSKSYYGRYNPNTNKITVYAYEDKNCTRVYSYDSLLDTVIHEFTHYIQYTNPNYKRVKGVMHDSNFWVLFNYFRDRIKSIRLWEELKAS